MKRFNSRCLQSLLFAGIAGVAAESQAITIEVDGSTYTTLSAAVAAAQAEDDGPDIINITAAALPTPDGEIVINQPLVINGNANSRPAPNDKCDILFDMATVMPAATSLGQAEKCYIEIQTSGTVEINDLKIHPNADGTDNGGGTAPLRVDGIRMYYPENEGEVGYYTLNRVWISGSNDANEYVPLDSGDDLFNTVATKRWGAGGGGASNAVIQGTGAGGDGDYHAVLNSCHAGLGKSVAISFPKETGTVKVFGGVFGHTGRDGIRVSGTTVTLQGTAEDRIRVIRATNYSGGDGHNVEIAGGGYVDLMEYVDSASFNTGQMFKIQGASVGTMRYCRGLGKYTDTANASMFVGSSTVFTADNVTIVGSGANYNPYETATGFSGTGYFTDSIFTSQNFGQLWINGSDNAVTTMSYCAIPTDLAAGESLADPPVGGTQPERLVIENSISVSPQFLLTLEDYDWSDAQGANDPLNGPGNHNVLRPGNPAYLTASSTGGPLTGGAGPGLSSIDSSIWMLMD